MFGVHVGPGVQVGSGVQVGTCVQVAVGVAVGGVPVGVTVGVPGIGVSAGVGGVGVAVSVGVGVTVGQALTPLTVASPSWVVNDITVESPRSLLSDVTDVRWRTLKPAQELLNRTVASKPLPVGPLGGGEPGVLHPYRTVFRPRDSGWQRIALPELPRSEPFVTEMKVSTLGSYCISNS